MFSRLVVLVQLAFLLGATVTSASPPPTVKLDNATVIGNTSDSVTSFTGIPYAQPPLVYSPSPIDLCRTEKAGGRYRVGDLRLRLPMPIAWYNGTIDATQPATQCIQLGPGLRDDMPPELLMEI